MDQLKLDKVKYNAGVALDRKVFNDGSEAYLAELITGYIRCEVRGNLFTKEAGTYIYSFPATWFDHLKQDNKWIRKLFGSPKIRRISLGVKVTLDPDSRRIPAEPKEKPRIITRAAAVWDKEWLNDDPAQPAIYNEMKFYPSFYVKEDIIE